MGLWRGGGQEVLVNGKGGEVEDADPKVRLEDGERGGREEEEGVSTDFESRRRKPLKKWLGIW